MDASWNKLSCVLCEQPLSAQHEQHEQYEQHEQHGDGSMAGVGKRVEYVVVELQGALALCQAVDDLSRTRKTVAAGLAEQLGIGLADLPGRRYTCWETPTEYGVIRSGFEPA